LVETQKGRNMTDQDTTKAPKCPHCDTQPLTFGENTLVTPTGTVVCIIWCAACFVTLTIQAVGKQPVVVADPTSKTGQRIKLM
jgi:hypothetical protein